MKPFFSLLFFCTAFSVAFAQNKKAEADFKRACYDLAEAFAKKNITTLNRYVDTVVGVYVIARPGAIDYARYQKKLDDKESFAVYSYKDSIKVRKHILHYGAAPKYDCGGEKWSKKGFYADTVAKHNHRLSEVIDFGIKFNAEEHTQSELDQIKKLERISRKITFTNLGNNGLVFYLYYYNKKWRLLLVDTTAGDCSA
jgi:hypothetical protein